VHLPFPNSLYRAQAVLFGFVAGARVSHNVDKAGIVQRFIHLVRPDQEPGSTLKADRRRNIKIALDKACNVVGVCV